MSRLVEAPGVSAAAGPPAPPATDSGMGESEPKIVLHRVGWDLYALLCATYAERRGPKIVFVDGRLTLLSPSRRHDRAAVYLDYLITAVADGLDLAQEVAGQSTFRVQALGVGVEGDRTFYFGEHAERMRVEDDIDLTTQPPPDLAVEVEVTHPADDAMLVYGRLGVPEVWRFDAPRESLTIWRRRDDGTYAPADRSAFLPVLEPGDVVAQLRLAREVGFTPWRKQLPAWVRDVLLPRRGGGA